jgi:heme oxygenase (mycobilin-producing)
LNIFITAGTLDYLKSIENKYPSETMVTMANDSGALLLHETNGATVFKEPRKYEVFDSAGNIKRSGFVVMNNFPVTDEGRPLFEQELKKRTKIYLNEPGFIAIRALRPLLSNTYVTLTIWETEMDYQNSKNLNSFSNALNKKGIGVDHQPKIFTSESYASQYTIID